MTLPKMSFNSIIHPGRDDNRFNAVGEFCTRCARGITEFSVSRDNNFIVMNIHLIEIFKHIPQKTFVLLTTLSAQRKMFNFYFDEFGRISIRANLLIDSDISKNLKQLFDISLIMIYNEYNSIFESITDRALPLDPITRLMRSI